MMKQGIQLFLKKRGRDKYSIYSGDFTEVYKKKGFNCSWNKCGGEGEAVIRNIFLEVRYLCRFRFSLVNLRQRVAKDYFPPPLDVTRRTQGTQNSGEQQSMNRASSSWWFIINRSQESTRSTKTTVARLLWTGSEEPAWRAKQHYITGYIQWS